MTKMGLVDSQRLFNNRMIFYAGTALMFMLIFIRNIIGISFPVILLLALYSAIVLFSGKDEIVALAVSCIPLSVAFQYKYALLITILLYLLKFYKEIRIKRILIPLLLMFAWELAHGLLYDLSANELLRGFAELIFVCFIIFTSDRKINYQFIYRFFAVSCVFICTVLFVSLLRQNNYDIMGVFTGTYRFGVRDETAENFGVNFNPNGLGFICNFAMALLFQLIFSKQHKKIDILLICALLFYGVLTMSRSFILCFVVLILLLLLTGKIPLKTKLKRAFWMLVGLLVLVGIIYLIIPGIVTKFIARFFESDISNGRIDIIKFYNEHLLSKDSHLWFGIGLQEPLSKIQLLYPETTINVAHNGIQELLVVWGVPGLLLFSWFTIELISSGRKGAKKTLLNYLPLILIFITIQFGQFISGADKLMALSLAYLSIKTDFCGGKNGRFKEDR